MAKQHYDVIVIGTGAGGGTIARRLAPSGKRILLLERGGFLPREQQNWNPEKVLIEQRYISQDTWYDEKSRAFAPAMHYFVGGATKLYGGSLFRLRREDFGMLKHHGGISPAWPISYDDLEPYYTEAEGLYQVHGQHGVDPTEPHVSGAYPFPPVSNSPRIQEVWDGMESAGYHPSPLPIGVMLDERNRHESPCIRCHTCDGFPCLVHAKSDAEVMGARPALQHSNVSLMTNCEVKRLETSPSGREVTSVVVDHDGATESYSADIVVVSAGAANSARLLLMSANDKHPNGLANGSDQVGRNFMYHNNALLLFFSRKQNPTRFQKTLALNDFYFGSDDFEYPMGHIQMFGKSLGEMFQGVVPFIPRSILEFAANRALDFLLVTEDLPDPENRVTLTSGDHIKLTYTRNNMVPMRMLIRKLKSILGEIGERRGWYRGELCVVFHFPVKGNGHQCGTCRFGSDPSTSVLDENCKAHELGNLYVVDTSFFPSSAAVNPALTAMANALRVGDRILERLS